MNKFNLSWNKAYAALLLSAATAIAAPAQTFTTLYSFCAQYGCPDGDNPLQARLVQGTDGNFYGATESGGASGSGTIFKITEGGLLTTLWSFDGTDGSSPQRGLLLGTDGNFYGTTNGGGNHGYGTVFKITRSGDLTTIYNFCQKGGCTDGTNPLCVLVEGADGNFYGTTQFGGTDGYGTVFKITPQGTLTTLHFFDYADGNNVAAGLVRASNGNFYGTTYGGGVYNSGTLFEIAPSGGLTTLYSFAGGTDGSNPQAEMIQGSDGNLYGTTPSGGATYNGTVFEFTPGGTLRTLYSLCPKTGCADGSNPSGGVVQATDGNFYGTTSSGGGSGDCPGGCGAVFSITPAGTETVLHTFVHIDGAYPQAMLVQGTNGTFYGTTSGGGANNEGSVFSLSVGLGPFVETLPSTGKTGRPVIILGTNLIGTTSVTFNGTAAAFRVVSKSAISTTVPAGATTGTVQVVTPSGTLSSNVPFRVAP